MQVQARGRFEPSWRGPTELPQAGLRGSEWRIAANDSAPADTGARDK